MRCGRRVNDVGWGRAREYGAWDVLAVGLGASLGARVRLGAIEMHGDM